MYILSESTVKTDFFINQISYVRLSINFAIKLLMIVFLCLADIGTDTLYYNEGDVTYSTSWQTTLIVHEHVIKNITTWE